MARYIDADKMREEWLENGENEYVYDTNSVLDSIDEQPTADVVEVEKVAEILADVAGASPCDFIGNEWLVSCCEHIGYCCATSDSECWVQYFKHYKERSEGDG